MNKSNEMNKIKINKNVYIIKAKNGDVDEDEELNKVLTNAEELNNDYLVDYFLNQNKHLFIFFYLVDCNPCIETKREWDKFKTVNNLSDNVVIMRINQALKPQVTENKTNNNIFDFERKGFPYIIYVKKGDGDELITEQYNNDRNIDAFNAFIQEKTKTSGGKKRSSARKRSSSARKRISKKRKVRSRRSRYSKKRSSR